MLKFVLKIEYKVIFKLVLVGQEKKKKIKLQSFHKKNQKGGKV